MDRKGELFCAPFTLKIFFLVGFCFFPHHSVQRVMSLGASSSTPPFSAPPVFWFPSWEATVCDVLGGRVPPKDFGSPFFRLGVGRMFLSPLVSSCDPAVSYFSFSLPPVPHGHTSSASPSFFPFLAANNRLLLAGGAFFSI